MAITGYAGLADFSLICGNDVNAPDGFLLLFSNLTFAILAFNQTSLVKFVVLYYFHVVNNFE